MKAGEAIARKFILETK